MATLKRKLNLNNMHTVLGAIEPTLALTDNKIMQINGHPCEIFMVQTVTDPDVNCQLQSNLSIVRGGVVVNMTTGVILPLPVKALQSKASMAVVTGSLPADNIFIVVVYGTEIR